MSGDSFVSGESATRTWIAHCGFAFIAASMAIACSGEVPDGGALLENGPGPGRGNESLGGRGGVAGSRATPGDASQGDGIQPRPGGGGGIDGAPAGHVAGSAGAGAAGVQAAGASAAGSDALEEDPGPPPHVYIAGDSTVMTYTNSTIHQAGWGQFLAGYLVAEVAVDNHAIGGRTSRRFIEEERLDAIMDTIESGDYLFVQFGTNDSNKTAMYPDGEPYYLAAATDFKTWMQQYIDAAAMHDARVVLVTPPPRKSCRDDGQSFNYSFGAYATAMRELADANQVPLIELGQRAVAFLDEKADCDWAGQNFFLIRADGSVDSTHFQEQGADILAGLVAAGVESLKLPLASFLR